MTKSLNLNTNYYLRIAFGMFICLFLGCKIATPVFAIAKADCKEVPVSSESDENKSVKINVSESDSEFIIPSGGFDHAHWFIQITHLTHYNNTYLSAYHCRITVPPPDVNLQFAI